MGRTSDDRWHVARDGKKIFCSGVTARLGEDAGAAFVKIARNFTNEQLRYSSREAELAHERATSGRLSELSAMKDQFLAVVSHELKNPLSMIQMNAQIIARLPNSKGDLRTIRSADSIMAAVSSQAKLIDDLPELSRANTGKIALSPTLIDLAEIVAAIVEAAQQDAQAKGQQLTADIEPATIFGDRVRVEQIVWNLVTNAIKFTPERGSARVVLSVGDGMARVSVDDSGIGLDPDHLEGIFEMFKQVQSGPTRAKPGLGIGLA